MILLVYQEISRGFCRRPPGPAPGPPGPRPWPWSSFRRWTSGEKAGVLAGIAWGMYWKNVKNIGF